MSLAAEAAGFALSCAARLITGAQGHWIGCAPKAEQRIYFANHQSHLDWVLIWAALPHELRATTRPIAARDNRGMGETIIPLADLRYAAALPRVPAQPAAPSGLLSDRLGRPLRDLRISVTDRCNFRCVYCMPKEVFDKDYQFLPHGLLLSFEEITRVAKIFIAHGVEKIRLTGGEPLLRKHIENIFHQRTSRLLHGRGCWQFVTVCFKHARWLDNPTLSVFQISQCHDVSPPRHKVFGRTNIQHPACVGLWAQRAIEGSKRPGSQVRIQLRPDQLLLQSQRINQHNRLIALKTGFQVSDGHSTCF